MASGWRSGRDRDRDRDRVPPRAFRTADMERDNREVRLDNERLRREVRHLREKVGERDEQLRRMKTEVEGLAEQLVAKSLEPGNSSRSGRGRREKEIEDKLRRELEQAKQLTHATVKKAIEDVERVQKTIGERDSKILWMNGVMNNQTNELRNLQRDRLARKDELESARKHVMVVTGERDRARNEFENSRGELEKMWNELEWVKKELDRTKGDHKDAVRSLNQMAASRKTAAEEYQATLTSKEAELEGLRKRLAGAEEKLQNARKEVAEKEELRMEAELKSKELTQLVGTWKKDAEENQQKLKNELALCEGQKGHCDLRILALTELVNSKDEALEEMKAAMAREREAEVTALKKELELAKQERVGENSKTSVVPSPPGKGKAAMIDDTTSRDSSAVGGGGLLPNCSRSIPEKHKRSLEDIGQSPKKAKCDRSRSSTEESSISSELTESESSHDEDEDGESKKMDCVGGAVAESGQVPPIELEASSKQHSPSSHSSMNMDSKAEVDNPSKDEGNSNERSVENDDMSNVSSPNWTKRNKYPSSGSDDDDLGKEDSSDCGSSTNARPEKRSSDDKVMSNDSEDQWKWIDFSVVDEAKSNVGSVEDDDDDMTGVSSPVWASRTRGIKSPISGSDDDADKDDFSDLESGTSVRSAKGSSNDEGEANSNPGSFENDDDTSDFHSSPVAIVTSGSDSEDDVCDQESSPDRGSSPTGRSGNGSHDDDDEIMGDNNGASQSARSVAELSDWIDSSEDEDEANPDKTKSGYASSSETKLAAYHRPARAPRQLLKSLPHGQDRNKPFFCICGGDYEGETPLQRHINYYRNRQQFPCNVCGKSLSTLGNLKSHKKRKHPAPPAPRQS